MDMLASKDLLYLCAGERERRELGGLFVYATVTLIEILQYYV